MPLTLPRPVVADNLKIKLCVYAEPGVGKTRLSGTAAAHPALGPVLILDLEGGLLSVSEMPGVESVEIRSGSDVDEAYYNLKTGRDGWNRFKTVVIDSGTVLSSRALVEATQSGIAKAAAKGKDVSDRTIDEALIGDYGKTTQQVRRQFSWFRDLPMHVIVTALPMTLYPPSEGENKFDKSKLPPLGIQPKFVPKGLSTDVMGMMDHVWYMYTGDDGTRYMLTRRSGLWEVKTRGEYFGPALGHPSNGIVTNPHLGEIYEILLRTQGSRSAATSGTVTGERVTA